MLLRMRAACASPLYQSELIGIVPYIYGINTKAVNHGVTLSSDTAFKDMKAAPSDTAKRAKAKLVQAIAAMDNYVFKGFVHTVHEWSDRIAHDQARRFFGCTFPDLAADSPLLIESYTGWHSSTLRLDPSLSTT